MSDPTVVAGIRALLSAGAGFGVAPLVTVRQRRGAYNTATGADPDPTDTDLNILLDVAKTKQDTSGKTSITQTIILLLDDLPNELQGEDQVIWSNTWNVQSFNLDPTSSFYEAVITR